MATEVFRKDYGETPEGYVCVVGFGGGPDGDGFAEVRYEVRKGVRTISTVDTEKKADAIAKALVA